MYLSRSTVFVLLSSALGIATSCSGSGSPQDDASGGGAGGPSIAPPQSAAPVVCSADEIRITDETNYSFSNDLQIVTSTLRSDSDLTFDWSAITEDFFGNPFDPFDDVGLGLITLWAFSPEQLQESIRTDSLSTRGSVGTITTYPDGTYASRNLYDFDLLGEPFDEGELERYFNASEPGYEYPPEDYTFMFMLSGGTVPGKDARMLHFFKLDPTSDNTTLTMTDASTTLTYDVELETAMPVGIPSGVGALTINWRDMTTNALGNDYSPVQITEAVVAHYSSLTLAQLEAQFLQLEDLADGWWWGEVEAGTSIQLDQLVDETGAAFSGIDEQGIWMVALFCTSSCNNPAPWSITILQPCD